MNRGWTILAFFPLPITMGANMLPLDQLEKLLTTVLRIREVVRPTG